MLYKETREQTAELLRLAIARMAQQPAAYHPLTYTVWYEHLAGINPRLTQALDRLLAAEQPIDDDTIDGLYESHVARLSEHREVRDTLQRLVQELSESVRSTDSRATHYEGVLARAGAELAETNLSQASLTRLVAALAEDTSAMQASVRELNGRLAASEREVALLRKQLAEARRESETDPLTGLANRRAFEAALASHIEARESGAMARLSLVTLDIDHFKRINDTWGHLLGDRVIEAMAQVLKARSKGRDLAARTGGEEMALLLPDTALDGARALAEQVREAFSRVRIKRAGSGETITNLTVSLGVAEYQPGEGPERWLERADRALYAAKEGGRDRVEVAAATAPAATA